jgi:hypothetical protein
MHGSMDIKFIKMVLLYINVNKRWDSSAGIGNRERTG